MFIERYLELSSELKYKKGQGAAHLQLGEIMIQKGDFNEGTKNFYRAMKIAEETGDNDQKEKAKVNFGMSNANLKWDKIQMEVLDKVKQDFNPQIRIAEEDDDHDEESAQEETD